LKKEEARKAELARQEELAAQAAAEKAAELERQAEAARKEEEAKKKVSLIIFHNKRNDEVKTFGLFRFSHFLNYKFASNINFPAGFAMRIVCGRYRSSGNSFVRLFFTKNFKSLVSFAFEISMHFDA